MKGHKRNVRTAIADGKLPEDGAGKKPVSRTGYAVLSERARHSTKQVVFFEQVILCCRCN